VILQDLKFKGFKNENNSESIDSIEEVEYDSDSDSDNWINDESTNKDINAIYSEIKDLLKSNIKNNIFSNTYFRFPIKNEKHYIVFLRSNLKKGIFFLFMMIKN
jgi:hypothetical protein